jgi:hypothetical protein
LHVGQKRDRLVDRVRVGEYRRAPVAAAIWPASSSGASLVACGPSSRAAGWPERRIRAAAPTAVSGTRGGAGTTASAGEGTPASGVQAASAGTISDATRPGAVRAAAMAAAASAATEPASGVVRTQWLNGRAVPSTSEVSGAS